MLFFYILTGFTALYVLTAAVFLLTARIGKTENGELVIDPGSWHFKIVYPFRKFDNLESFPPINLCGYFAQFFFMLFLGWPFLVFFLFLKTVVYLPFFLMFGRYPVANLMSMRYPAAGAPFWVEAREIRLLRPKIKGFTFYPFYLIVPLAYGLGCLYYPSIVSSINWILSLFAVIVLGACFLTGFQWLFNWLKTTNEHSISLVKEMVRAKINKWCPRVTIIKQTR